MFGWILVVGIILLIVGVTINNKEKIINKFKSIVEDNKKKKKGENEFTNVLAEIGLEVYKRTKKVNVIKVVAIIVPLVIAFIIGRIVIKEVVLALPEGNVTSAFTQTGSTVFAGFGIVAVAIIVMMAFGLINTIGNGRF